MYNRRSHGHNLTILWHTYWTVLTEEVARLSVNIIIMLELFIIPVYNFEIQINSASTTTWQYFIVVSYHPRSTKTKRSQRWYRAHYLAMHVHSSSPKWERYSSIILPVISLWKCYTHFVSRLWVYDPRIGGYCWSGLRR